MSLSKKAISSSDFRKIILVILILNILSRAYLVSRPLPYLDSLIIPDDAYISLHIAKNIGTGKGPLYGHDFTNGFQPLYVFIMAPIFTLFPDNTTIPVKIALVILTLFDTATLCVLLAFVYSVTQSKALTVLSSVFWIFNDYIIQTSLNGLETIIASFFILWATYIFYRLYFQKTSRRPLELFTLGIVTGFACISRVDSGVFAIILFVLIAIKELKNLKQATLYLMLFGVGVMTIFSFWVAYSYYYTSTWYPISGKAVRYLSLTTVDHLPTWENWYKPMLTKGISVIAKQNVVLFALLLISLVFLALKKKLNKITFYSYLPLAIFSFSLYMAYTLYIFTPWYFYRYFFPIALFTILLLVQCLNISMKSIEPKYQTAFLLFVCLFWVSAQIAKGEITSYYLSKKTDYGYMNLALLAKDRFPDGTIVGGSQTGALSYFADNLTIINLDGVVNEECYNSLINFENMDYIKKSNIDYVVGWEYNATIIKNHSRNFKDSDLQLIEKIEGLKTWDRNWFIYKVNK